MKTERKYIILLVLVMLATMRHSASVYLSISPTKFDSNVLNWLYAVGVVSVLDLVVIIFTVEGSKRLPIVYAVGLGILSGLYFLNYAPITEVVGSVVFMILIPLAGYEFSELFKAKRTESDALRQRTQDYQALADALEDLKREVNQSLHEQGLKIDGTASRVSSNYHEVNRKLAEARTILDDAGQQVEARVVERFRKRLERLEKKGGADA